MPIVTSLEQAKHAGVATNAGGPLGFTDVSELRANPPAFAGDVSSQGDLPLVVQALGAAVARSHKDDFYYRFHLRPTEFDFGNVLTSQQVTATLWNAYFISKTVDAVQTPGEGIDITEPAAAPYSIDPLEEAVYTIDVLKDGPSTFNQTLAIGVGAITLTVTMIGTRLVIWTFEPNWKKPLREILSWKTNVLESYSGMEQRAGLRDYPRRTSRYITTLFEEELQAADNLLHGWQNKNMVLPVWTEFSPLTQAATAGETELWFDTTNRTFEVGRTLGLFTDSNTFEVMTITELYDDRVVFTQPLAYSWAVGHPAYPVHPAWLNQDTPFKYISKRIGEMSLDWDSSADNYPITLPVEAAALTYEGVEVLLKEPEVSGGTSVFKYEEADSQVGAQRQVTTESYRKLKLSGRWLVNGLAEKLEWFAFLQRRKGRLRPFLLPTWNHDFTVAADSSTSSQTIYLEINSYDRAAVNDYNRQRILILQRGNDPFLTRIDSAVVEAGKITVGIADALPFDLKASRQPLVSFLSNVRLASDSVTLNHLHTDLMTLDLPFITAPEIEP